jgi:NADPH-dependent ferric siderophore reductase
VPRISRDTDIYPISLRELEVVRVEDVTPGMRRVTFGGPGLHAHTRDGVAVPALVSDGFDDDIRIIFPDPVTGARPYPAPLADGRLDWNAEVNDLFRTYTVRSWRPESGEYGELTVDFARHGAGLAEDWSAAAVPGDRVYIAGPKNCGSLPVHTGWLLLVGDETALPAIGRCLEEVPVGHPVRAFVEVAERADIQQIDCAGDLDLRWSVRAEGQDAFADVLSLAGDTAAGAAGAALPDGVPFVWAAGEAGRLKGIRRFAKAAGVPREHTEITGYWRVNDSPAGTTGDGAAAAGARDGGSSIAPLMALHEMADITPGLALRAAARLGLFEAVETVASEMPGASGNSGTAGTVPVSALGDALGVDPGHLLRFLRYLGTLNLVVLHPGEDSAAGTAGTAGTATVGLASLGRELADPDGPVSRLTGPEALRDLTWLHLDRGLRSGRPVPVGATGQTWAELRAADPAVVDALADAEATRAQWVAPALATGFADLAGKLAGPAGAPVTAVAVAGAGEGTAAAVYADELLRHDPGLRVTVLDTGAGTDRLTAEVGEGRRDRLTVVPFTAVVDAAQVGVTVVVDPFALAGPDRVPSVLTAAATVGGASCPVVVVTRLLAESGDEDHDYGEDLTRLLLDGTAVPTRRDLSRAVAAAGLRGTADIPVGWGHHAVVAVPAN